MSLVFIPASHEFKSTLHHIEELAERKRCAAHIITHRQSSDSMPSSHIMQRDCAMYSRQGMGESCREMRVEKEEDDEAEPADAGSSADSTA
jgi:hypothetical protein